MTDFHSKMSVCRHELGGSTPHPPRQFQPWVYCYCSLTYCNVLLV